MLAVVAGLGAAATIGASPSASAGTGEPPATPPGYVGAPGGWMAFTLVPTDPPVALPGGRFARVTLNRESAGLDPATALNWDFRTCGPGCVEEGWPATWSRPGLELHRVGDWCPIAQGSCDYFVTAYDGEFWYAAGTAPDEDGDGAPDTGFFLGYRFASAIPPPPPVVASFPSPPTGGVTTGVFTFDASGSQAGLGTITAYHWTLRRLSDDATWTSDAAVFTPPDEVFTTAGDYEVTLTVTASDTASATFGPVGFAVVPAKPDPEPPQGPGPGPGSGAGPGLPAAPASTFGGPRISPNDARVVWLWRPDWFQSDSDNNARRGDRQPTGVKGRVAIAVDPGGRSGPSAAPWLAGLGAVGVGGYGLIARLRRRVRVLDG